MICSSISQKLSRGIVILAFLGIASVILFVGPAQFLLGAGPILLMFPLLFSYASGFPLPGWLLISLYALPVLWGIGLWTTGIRAWDRSSLSAAGLFLALTAFGVAMGFWLMAHASGGNFYH